MDETLRQTYAHLEDQMNYQGSQINELGLVFENTDMQAQRENFDQLQVNTQLSNQFDD